MLKINFCWERLASARKVHSFKKNQAQYFQLNFEKQKENGKLIEK